MEDNYLRHFGVLGMHWGKRGASSKSKSSSKQKEKEFQKKLTALNNNKSLQGTSDAARFNYRSRGVGMRVAKTAVNATSQMIIKDVLTGKFPANKKDIAIRIAQISAYTAGKVVLKDRLAKSAATRYTDEGKLKPGSKRRITTKEDGIEAGVVFAVKAAYIGKWALGMKAKQVNATRAKNEANFKRWGANILPQRVDNVVWQSSDLKTAIIDNRRR